MITISSKLKATAFKCILATAILLFILPQAVVASGEFKLSVVSEKGNPGDQVTVQIRADNAEGTEGGQFLLAFDPNLVKPVSSEAGELVAKAKSNLHMVNLDYAPGQLMVLWVTPYADTADSGVVTKIVFDLLKKGETSIGFSEIIVAPDGTETAVAVPGKVTISDSVTGPDPDDSEPADPDQEAGDPADSDDEQIFNGDSNDENVDDNGIDDNFSIYAIVLVVLAFLLTIGYFIIKRLKKPAVKK